MAENKHPSGHVLSATGTHPMIQDQIFLEREGNHWFQRNRQVLSPDGHFDWVSHQLSQLENLSTVSTILELGCANGWRLAKLRQKLGRHVQYAGIDASLEAIQAGQASDPALDLQQGLLSNVPVTDPVDVVIVSFVLHWVDRKTLATSISEIDRLVKDNGILIISDFLPDAPTRRPYHHCPDEAVYTYKQDYTKLFKALGTYQELSRVTFNHDTHSPAVSAADQPIPGNVRCAEKIP